MCFPEYNLGDRAECEKYLRSIYRRDVYRLNRCGEMKTLEMEKENDYLIVQYSPSMNFDGIVDAIKEGTWINGHKKDKTCRQK